MMKRRGGRGVEVGGGTGPGVERDREKGREGQREGERFRCTGPTA